MKNLFYFLSLLFIISTLNLFGQEENKSFGIRFTGYVKNDFFYDSRQIVGLREGHVLLFPANESLDKNGKDINESPTFNILSIQSRILGHLSGPDALGAKTSGLIEAEFFGTSDSDVNGFRLRHAFVKLDWGKTNVMIGQYWHPLLIQDMYPEVVSFNTGAPLQPISRNPQIRLNQYFGDLRITLAAMTQRDFGSFGPDGVSSSYLRNAVIPNLHLQLRYEKDNNFIGVGIDYKKIVPRIKTTKNYKTDEAVSGISLFGYAKMNISLLSFRIYGILGENIAEQLMMGGYAVKSIDTITGTEKYTPIKILSGWGEIIYGKEVELALFAGYAKNLGANDNTTGVYYGRAYNIESLFRIAPRIQYNIGKVRLSFEYELTTANYGINNSSNKGKVENTKAISNSRLLGAVYYFF